MIRYHSPSKKVLGEIRNYRSYLIEEYRERGLIDDSTDPETLKQVLPAYLTHGPSELLKIMMKMSTANPTSTPPIIEISKVIKTEICIRYGRVHKVEHVLDLFPPTSEFDFPHFVCGFMDHKDKNLQKWRNL